jgi:predicted transcriptional regulator
MASHLCYDLYHIYLHTLTMAILNMRLDDELDRRLAREASLENQTRSELARAAIATYLAERERRRFQAQILRAARARGDRQAVAMAEEALYTGNEALELSEIVAAQPKARYSARQSKRKKR